MNKFYARRGIFGDVIELVMYQRTTHSDDVVKLAVAQPVEFKTRDENTAPYEPAPMLSLQVEDAQRLMDELWHVGLRPTEGTGSAGSLAATERHLADMRALVFAAQQQPVPAQQASPM